MKSKRSDERIRAIMIAAVFFGIGVAKAETLYQELFSFSSDMTGTLSEPTNSYGWRVAGWDGTTFRTGNSALTHVAAASAGGTTVPGGGSINSNPLMPDGGGGYIYAGYIDNSGTEILYTDEKAIPLSQLTDITFRWNHTNNNGSERYRALIAVSPDPINRGWNYSAVDFYITQSVVTTNNNADSWLGNVSFDLGSASWFQANVNNIVANGSIGISVGRAATKPLLGSYIVGFGLYMENKQDDQRIDNFAVTQLESGLLFQLLTKKETQSLVSYLAVDRVCAWPNLTALPNGTVIATIFNKPSHLQEPGDVDCWASEDGGSTWTKRGTPAPRDNELAARGNVAAGLATNGDLLVMSGGWSDPASSNRGTLLSPIVSRSSNGGYTWVIKSNNIAFPKDDVIYHELFSTTNTVLTTVGWSGYLGTNGAFTTAANIATTTGIAWDGGPVNSYPLTVTTNATGSAYNYINVNQDTLIITEEYSFGMSAFTNLQFSMRNNFEKATDVRAAIEVDGVWYVSDGVAVQALAGWAAAKLWKVNADSIAWHPLNFTAGSNLVVGASTVTLPKTGTAQAFGFYSESLPTNDWNRVRADNFMLSGNAIPVPTLIPYGDIQTGADGALYIGLYSGSSGQTYLFRSADDGATWRRNSMPIDSQTVINEPALFHLGEGRWLCAARTRAEGLDLYVSSDDARTWIRRGKLTGKAEVPGHFLRLSDGRILLTYGNRQYPEGVDVRVSDNEGASWSLPVRLANFTGWDGGYPSSVQTSDGQVLTAYYHKISEPDGYRMSTVIWDPSK